MDKRHGWLWSAAGPDPAPQYQGWGAAEDRGASPAHTWISRPHSSCLASVRPSSASPRLSFPLSSPSSGLSVCSQALNWPLPKFEKQLYSRIPATSGTPWILFYESEYQSHPATMRNRSSLLLGCVLLCSASLLYLGMSGIQCPPKSHRYRWMELNLGSANQSLSLTEHFPEDTPLIFIGGFPRSGTTLMRVMLDAHNHVRCGEETRVIPRLLAMRATWSRSVKERIRLDEAGVTDQVLDAAVRAFLLEVSWSVHCAICCVESVPKHTSASVNLQTCSLLGCRRHVSAVYIHRVIENYCKYLNYDILQNMPYRAAINNCFHYMQIIFID